MKPWPERRKHEEMFEAYVTNPGLYPELGVEVGETLKFPTTTEEVQALFSRIGIDGERYGEYFITSYDSDVLGLYDCLDELNYLAHILLKVQEQGDIEKFEAAVAFGEEMREVTAAKANIDYLLGYAEPGRKKEQER